MNRGRLRVVMIDGEVIIDATGIEEDGGLYQFHDADGKLLFAIPVPSLKYVERIYL